MDKFVPYEKLSKKKKRQLDAEKRGSWYGLNPITRKPKNPKAYDRKKARCWRDDSSNVLSSYVEVGAVSIQLFNAPSIISHHQKVVNIVTVSRNNILVLLRQGIAIVSMIYR